MKMIRLYKNISLLVSKQQTRRQLQHLPEYLLDDLALSEQQIEVEMKKNSLSVFCQALLRILFNYHSTRK